MRIFSLAFVVFFGALAAHSVKAANQDFEAFSDWPSPVNRGPTLNTAAEESAPALSDDGRSLYFNRNPNLPNDNDEDLYVSHRGGPHEEWGDPVPLATINTPAFHERNAMLSRDGLLLFFSSSPAAWAGSTCTSRSGRTGTTTRAGRRR